MEPRPRHGTDGWILADYEWDELSGNGRFTYRRGADADAEKRIVDRSQRVSDEFHQRMAEEQRNQMVVA